MSLFLFGVIGTPTKSIEDLLHLLGREKVGGVLKNPIFTCISWDEKTPKQTRLAC